MTETPSEKPSRLIAVVEVVALVCLFFVYAGDIPPAVNEAHYLVKAKNFWDPSFVPTDLFAASGKAHTTFYVTFGWLTKFFSLEMTAWIGRMIGWIVVAIGLRLCCLCLRMPPFFSVGVAVLWLVGIEHGNLAGEWVIGGIEGKVPAYGFVLIGLSKLMKRNWSIAWVWFGIASAFHVLTGGWMVVASMIAFLATERIGRTFERADDEVATARFFVPGLFIGGGIALFGLVPAYQLTMLATNEESTLAARIYSYVRIRHHLLPGDFPAHWFIRFGALVVVLLLVTALNRSSSRLRRLNWVGIGAVVITLAGLVVGALPAIAPDLAARLLRYYWFRLGDAMVPFVLSLTLMESLNRRRGGSMTSKPLRLIATILLAIASVSMAHTSYDRIRLGVPPSTSHRLLGFNVDASPSQQQVTHRDWVAVCDWVRTSTPIDEVFLTPRHQQSFKWYASRGEVVNWKDVPQDAKSMIEWLRRFEDVFPKRVGMVPLNSMRVPIGYSKLRSFRERYGVRFMIVDNRIATTSLPLVKVYPVGNQENRTYSVYELPY